MEQKNWNLVRGPIRCQRLNTPDRWRWLDLLYGNLLHRHNNWFQLLMKSTR